MIGKKDSPSGRSHCMIVHAYYPLGETRVQREAELLAKYHYEVDVLCLRKKGEPATDRFKNVNIYRLPVRRHKESGLLAQFFEYTAFFFLAMMKVTRLHKRKHYNTIQVHNLPDFLVFAASIPKLLGSRIVLDLHDLMPEFYMGRFQRDAKSLPLRLVCLQERSACNFAHHVITVSHHWRKALADRGIPFEKTSVVMNVADPSIFKPHPRRERPLETRQAFHLVYHGTVTQRYGLDLVLQAMAQLREKDIHFTVLGRGDHMGTLIRTADELNLNGKVTFHCEFWPAEDLPNIISTADAGVVPYRNDPFTDGLVPTKLMEYAASGLPSIAARTTAIAQYFDDTMVEFFTPNNVDELVSCISRLYDDRVRLAQLAQGITRFNNRYNWKNIGSEYVTLVQQLGT